MKIRKLTARNIKGIKNISIDAKRLNEICGKNGEGKTSTLDCLRMAFEGAKAISIQDLRQGEAEGAFMVETDELVIKSQITEEGKIKFIAKTKEGLNVPQGYLNSLVNDLTFDPSAFSKMNIKDQVSYIERVAGEEFCAEKKRINDEIKILETERTFVGRQAKELGNVELPPEVKEVSVESLLKQVDEIEAHNTRQNAKAKRISDEKENLDTVNESIADLENKLENLRKKANDCNVTIAALEQPEPLIDPAPIKAQISEATSINKQASTFQAALKRKLEREAKDEQYKSLTKQIEDLRQKSKEHDLTINIPVDGLVFTETGVEVNGIPLDKLARSEKLKIGMRLLHARNPKLRDIVIEDGSDLDTKSFEEIDKFCAEHDMQCWVETVEFNRTSDAIIIEMGQVKE
jgi:DNA repair exonuclease SbcCD ATPase subunit